MDEDQPKKPKIIVDDDWKEQVQAEKEQLKQQQQQPPPAPQAPQRTTGEQAAPTGYPPPSFSLLVSTVATQALFAMGQVADPQSPDPPQVDLPAARHQIDLLDILREKTAGNLSSEEAAMLENVLHELRMLYVAVQRSQSAPPGPAK